MVVNCVNCRSHSGRPEASEVEMERRALLLNPQVCDLIRWE